MNIDKIYEYKHKLQQENSQLKDNWNKLKEWLDTLYDIIKADLIEKVDDK